MSGKRTKRARQILREYVAIPDRDKSFPISELSALLLANPRWTRRNLAREERRLQEK